MFLCPSSGSGHPLPVTDRAHVGDGGVAVGRPHTCPFIRYVHVSPELALILLVVEKRDNRGGSRGGGCGLQPPLSYSFIHTNTQYSNGAIIASC